MSRTDQTGSDKRLKLEFWGVRGSIATPESDKLRTGGNTPCTVLQYGSEPLVIIDAGTGLRLLGRQLTSPETDVLQASILFSHFHWDHIQGLPFFGPIYSHHAKLQLYSTLKAESLQKIVELQMNPPFFPLPLKNTPAVRSYNQTPTRGCKLGSLTITPVRLSHPGGASGYRLESPAGSVIYVSDHEHGNAAIDDAIAEHAAGADILIYDAHFTPDEYERSYKGWGHSTWREGARLANRAAVGELILFHHSPDRTDRELPTILADARLEFANTEIARENQPILLARDRGLGAQPVTVKQRRA
ncbi:MAG: MBL fold metallo-hydrolase [Acidobacteriaceae bacterium]|nr:MBL fold metallo-hydrolase [Acidobacteriaceae bacterium]